MFKNTENDLDPREEINENLKQPFQVNNQFIDQSQLRQLKFVRHAI